ncbi:methionyl-tRNA formyltransferase [Paraglaciecola mesophila KMM 241]|uniref:Methionyl-tRNA formyltransferase n=1 Tax=Paraglaciecola mesophila KMM 241 TaxID=1128912 RepID=K6Z8L3_9ALTE|nr:methionyl-tRNA formyltransferase [Paraglaciecola mesophila]GAC26727.1 methionyl-tRNA formyltransferase [Paraglaciecola mesophila KMM 241]
MKSGLKIVFAGTPEFAANHLSALIESEHQVIAAYTQPDRPAGRGKRLHASAVKQLAQQHDIPVYQPASLKSEEAQQQLAALNADVMVVVAYGLILPQIILDTPKYGCLNVHGSLLPKWRGAAPIQRAIWAGDAETGVTIMQMDKGLDTGAMLSELRIAITPTDTSATLYTKLAQLGPKGLLETLASLRDITPQAQDNTLATYAEKLSKQEAKIDWTMTAAQLERNVRAFDPWPVAYFEANGAAIKVRSAEVQQTPIRDNAQPGQIVQADKHAIGVQTGDGVFLIKTLQLPGKKPLATQDILNGHSDWFSVGTILS